MNLAKKIQKIVSSDDLELKYAHILRILCAWIDTCILIVIGGRGLAKSTEIQAERILSVIYDMAGAPVAIVADTYANLSTKIMLAIKIGWKRKGYIEGVHYVCNKRPPQEWLDKCSITGISNWKNTIFWHNGSVIFGGSLDRPSLLAGLSVVHIFWDEAKYHEDKRVDAAMPTLRGDAILYGRSVYFLGMTITTDMPDVTKAEYDWFFKFVKSMNPERIVKILEIYDELNKVRIKILKETQKSKPSQARLKKLEKEADYWLDGWNRARHEQTFFINASSLVNIEILTLKYVKQQWRPEDQENFNKSILGMRPTLTKDARFYALLNESHFYYDGYDYTGYYDKFPFGEIPESSLGLKYVKHDQVLELGMDFGNQTSMIVGQTDDNTTRLLKEFWVLSPDSNRALADQFLAFFKDHQNKEIDIYYDRAANNYEAQGKDLAGEIRDCLQKDGNGNRTGWTVNLKSRKQGTIFQGTEYYMALNIMGAKNPKLPKLLIDANNCKCLKSSMEKSPKGIKTSRKGTKLIIKIKKSEKLALKQLPMNSTNFSDAFKYYICRRDWIRIHRASTQRTEAE